MAHPGHRASSLRALPAFNGAADGQKHWISPQNLYLSAGVFTKGWETLLKSFWASSWGTEELGLRKQNPCIPYPPLFHCPTQPLQAAIQLPVKEILTSRGCEQTYGPIKNPYLKDAMKKITVLPALFFLTPRTEQNLIQYICQKFNLLKGEANPSLSERLQHFLSGFFSSDFIGDNK